MRELLEVEARTVARTSFLPFVKEMWPAFVEGPHHKKMAEAFERVATGDLRRLIINMAPRHTKSEFASHLLPAWFLGQYPHKKIIQASHTAELAVGFGRKVRNLLNGMDYQRIFDGITLSSDSKAAGRWNTNHGGEYFAVGVGGAIAGKGADLLIIDDPHDEQEAASDPSVYDKAYEWFTSGPRQRLQPGGAIVIVMTRWSKRDLTGQIVQTSIEKEGVDEWEIIELPAILPSGTPIWPQFWKLEELERIKAEIPVGKWNAQYQQTPTSEEGAIIKREWWQEWTRRNAMGEPVPPQCEAIIISWDTAFLRSETADYSACTTWGIFYRDDDQGRSVPNVILLDAFKDRWEFPDLKVKAAEHFRTRSFEADGRVMVVIEAKASGLSLIQELRRAGIPIQEYKPTRGNDKIARANSVSDLFASGAVWAPRTRWAEEVIEECASFPNGDHDDFVDSTTQALLRFRQGNWITLPSDWEDEATPEPAVAFY